MFHEVWIRSAPARTVYRYSADYIEQEDPIQDGRDKSYNEAVLDDSSIFVTDRIRFVLIKVNGLRKQQYDNQKEEDVADSDKPYWQSLEIAEAVLPYSAHHGHSDELEERETCEAGSLQRERGRLFVSRAGQDHANKTEGGEDGESNHNDDHEHRTCGHALQFSELIGQQKVTHEQTSEAHLHQIVLLAPDADGNCAADGHYNVKLQSKPVPPLARIDRLPDEHKNHHAEGYLHGQIVLVPQVCTILGRFLKHHCRTNTLLPTTTVFHFYCKKSIKELFYDRT